MGLVVAYQIECETSLPQMLAALRAATSWSWREGFSDIWDEYIAGAPEDQSLTARIYHVLEAYHLAERIGAYLIEFEVPFDKADSWEDAVTPALGLLVQALAARGVRRADSYN